MGHRQVPNGNWFVLDLTGCHCFVLVQVKRARKHAFCGLLVAAGRSRIRVLGGGVGVGLVGEGTCCSASSPPAPAPPPAHRREALRLLSGDCRCHRQRVGVVLPHVFHQVGLLREEGPRRRRTKAGEGKRGEGSFHAIKMADALFFSTAILKMITILNPLSVIMFDGSECFPGMRSSVGSSYM